MKKFWMLAWPLLACAFVSCNDNDEPEEPTEPKIEYDVITFEDCEFPEGKKNNYDSSNGVHDYTELGATFSINNYYGMLTGVGVSSAAYLSDSESGTPKNGCVALASDVEHAGADGSDKFGFVCKYSRYDTPDQGIVFGEGVERTVASLMVMNATSMRQYIEYGFYSYGPLTDGFVKVIFTGYNAAGEETGSVAAYLANKVNEDYVMSDWTEVDLSPLGKVNKALVTYEWSDGWTPGNGSMLQVCIDNIKLVKE